MTTLIKQSASFIRENSTSLTLVLFLFLSLSFLSFAQETEGQTMSTENLSTSTTTEPVVSTKPIREIKNAKVELLVKDKTRDEVIKIKSRELAKLQVPFIFYSNEHDLKLSIEKISEISGGVEVLVKAWKNGKPLGFGAYGTVETERIRIINPPVLVYEDGHLTENLKEAIGQSLGHTVSIIGRGGDHIVPGKIGNTTTTVYPNTGTGGTTTDGRMFEDRYTSWSTTVNGSSCRITSMSDGNQDISNSLGNGFGPTYYSNNRLHFGFDTSAMPDTDGIALATFSVHGIGDDLSAGSERRIYLVSSNPSSDNTLITSDYGNVGTTSLGVTDGTWTTSGYNNIPLNSSGLAYIDKTGVTNFALRGWYDFNATAPDNSNELYVYGVFADETGTASDPKLVIEHATCN